MGPTTRGTTRLRKHRPPLSVDYQPAAAAAGTNGARCQIAGKPNKQQKKSGRLEIAEKTI